jgi:hypothetical protein
MRDARGQQMPLAEPGGAEQKAKPSETLAQV